MTLERELLKTEMNRKLGDRSERPVLQSRGILIQGDVSPSLQGRCMDLEKAIHKNQFKAQFEKRPSLKQVHDINILHDGPGGSIQATKEHLAKQMKADALNRALEHRPTVDVLVNQNILPSTFAPPSS